MTWLAKGKWRPEKQPSSKPPPPAFSDAEPDWKSYRRGYETGCAAASYTNEESNLAHIHVLEQERDRLRKALRELVESDLTDSSPPEATERHVEAMKHARAVLRETSDA